MTETEKRLHRCCFTGHRPEKLNQTEQEVKEWLSVQIDSAISDGYTTFITGMAMGVDLWAAEIIISKKATHPIHLIAATPYPSFPFRWSDEWKEKYNKVWEAADFRVEVKKEYSKDAFQKRDEWMVDHSSLVIAYYNGEKGGTQNTIKYAEINNIKTIVSVDQISNLPYPENLLKRLGVDKWPDDIAARLTISLFSLRSVRDIEVIEKRYKDKKTLQVIGDEYGLSRERVRQLIVRAEKTLTYAVPFLRGEKTDDEKLLKKEWLLEKVK